MNVKASFLIFLLTFAVFTSFSQQLSHQVMVPVAGIISGNDVSYTQTGGETAVEIISGSGFVLSQGFQQPGIHSVPARENPKGNGVNVYPNPARDFINVEFFGEAGRSFRIDILNMAGTVLLSEKIGFQVKFWIVKEINITDLMKGAYLVRVASHDGNIKRTFIIQKL